MAGLSSLQPIRLLENDLIAPKQGLMTSQKGIKALVSLETAFWTVDTGETTALRNKVNIMAAQYGASSMSGVWTQDDLPDMAMEKKNLMWVQRWLCGNTDVRRHTIWQEVACTLEYGAE